ncbi:hypothetical protein BJ138DRAFT_1117612 [Hygrophoropsis aurantiaca]|uniref:Uncharacterized protein n=1 Tax=Hygrophoropsis aurantiaca TaxID=72124 RepID=A0ACB8A0C1_9AGAM|nr:hypothetical protein BJ138DRAFT_1117612 [Hygrophoropsis aurantiaca]
MPHQYSYPPNKYDLFLKEVAGLLESADVSEIMSARDGSTHVADEVAAASQDVVSLAGALEALQLVQANDDTSFELENAAKMRKQLEDEIVSLRALLAAAQYESKRLHRVHFHTMRHYLDSNSPLFQDAASSGNISEHDSADNDSRTEQPIVRSCASGESPTGKVKCSAHPRSPRSPQLPPHLIAAGFRMCHDD